MYNGGYVDFHEYLLYKHNPAKHEVTHFWRILSILFSFLSVAKTHSRKHQVDSYSVCDDSELNSSSPLTNYVMCSPHIYGILKNTLSRHFIKYTMLVPRTHLQKCFSADCGCNQ